MSTAICPNLFVYGTLRRGSPHPLARTLEDQASFIGNGRMQGRLYGMDRYPGMIASSDPRDWVIGDLYRLHDPGTILAILDEYEGCGATGTPPYEFERVLAAALADSGTPVECWVYLYRGRVTEEARILGGDFLAGR